MQSGHSCEKMKTTQRKKDREIYSNDKSNKNKKKHNRKNRNDKRNSND